MRLSGGAFMLLLVVCLLNLSAPGYCLTEDKITDLAGHNLTYQHGQNLTVLEDEHFHAMEFGGQEFQVQVMNLDLYQKPVQTFLWVSEAKKNITIDVFTEMYDRLNASGGDVAKAVLGNVTIAGIPWHTVTAPKKQGSGTNFVAMIAYSNGQRTATVMMDESRPNPDQSEFNRTLEYVKFEKDPKTPGLPLAYFF